MLETPAQRIAPARAIAQRLLAAKSIAISTHVNGDGDGWGSACALAHQLTPRGIDVRLLAASPFPPRYQFLLPQRTNPLAADQGGLDALATAELQLVVDASEPGRLAEFAPLYQRGRTIVIDHHAVASNSIASTLALIDPGAAATAELIYDVLAQAALTLEPEAAQALYVGLVTDTGSFRYSNTGPRAHRLAALLIEAGADPEALYRPLFARLSLAELGTLRAALDRLERDEDLGISWTVLDLAVGQRFGGLDEYEGILEHLRNLEGTEVAILFREQAGGDVKVSLRSTGPANVSELARGFGGGGHEKAAGATLSGDLATVSTRVLEACRSMLRRQQTSGS